MSAQTSKKPKPSVKLCTGVLLFLIVFALSTEWLLVGGFRHDLVKRTTAITASFIELQAGRNLSDKDFLSGDYHARLEKFTEFYQEIKTADILGLRVYNRGSVVIFSDDEALIGQTLKEEGISAALEGKLTARTIKPPLEKDKIYGGEYKRFLKIYIPVISAATNEIIAVISPDYKLNAIYATVCKVRLYVWLFVILSCLLLAVAFLQGRNR